MRLRESIGTESGILRDSCYTAAFRASERSLLRTIGPEQPATPSSGERSGREVERASPGISRSDGTTLCSDAACRGHPGAKSITGSIALLEEHRKARRLIFEAAQLETELSLAHGDLSGCGFDQERVESSTMILASGCVPEKSNRGSCGSTLRMIPRSTNTSYGRPSIRHPTGRRRRCPRPRRTHPLDGPSPTRGHLRSRRSRRRPRTRTAIAPRT